MMLTTRRLTLALLRLLLLYGLLCFLILALGLEIRQWKEAGWGLNSLLPTLLAPQQPPFLGINIDLLQADTATRRADLARLRATGFGWARQRFDWGLIEPQPGQFEWARSDALLHDLRETGLQPVVVLDGSPAWARTAQDQVNPLAPPAEPATFARFAAAFAKRYRDHILYYQIWNEPNIAPHWGNRHIEPIAYAQLLKAAAAAIRKADPTALLLTAALAPTRDRGHTAIDELYFLQRLYAADAADAFDAVAVQPFGFGAAPGDPRERLDILNFQRIKLVRRVMLAAGDSATPIWAVRFGWNTRLNSRWGTVSPTAQRVYTQEALTIGYQQWPWLAAMGWLTDRPVQPSDDPLWGFALTPNIQRGIRDWVMGMQPAPRQAPIPNTQYPYLLGLVITSVMVCWRAYAAVTLLPWSTWGECYRAWPVGFRCLLWAGLLLFYYFATWPPLIGLSWLVAAMLLAAQPQHGLYLAALLLPFHVHHKEIHLVDSVWAIAPAQAVLFCLLPGLLLHLKSDSGSRSGQETTGRLRLWRGWVGFDWLALAWLLVNLLTSLNVWHWPGYRQGLLSLALAPLLLYSSVRLLITTPNHWRSLATTLCGSGLLVALLGLITWSQGQGVAVDSVLRLAGPYYSPNQAALYLERTVWLSVGLALVATARPRWGWWASGAIMVLALLLTASRGALLLALPAGLVLWLWLHPRSSVPTMGVTWPRRLGHILPGRHRLVEAGLENAARNGVRERLSPQKLYGLILTIASLLIVGIALMAWGERLANSTTILSRLQIWRTTLALWQDQPWLGVGPGGFFWRYPAYLIQPTLEPNLYHPHNLWLEFAAHWGIIGCAWLIVLLAGLWRLRRVAVSDPVSLGLVAGLVAGVAHAQVDAFAALPDLAGWNWLALALLVQKERVMPLGHDPDSHE